MGANWLHYGMYGAAVGFVIGFLAGYLRAQRGSNARSKRADETISALNRLVQKFARSGVSDDEAAR